MTKEDTEKDEQVLDIDDTEKKALTSSVREKLKDLSVDYARGGGQIFSDSSSSEEESTDDDEDDVYHLSSVNINNSTKNIHSRKLSTLGANLTKTQKRRMSQLCGLLSATWIGTESGQMT